jgi:hypothetical protein
LRTTDVRTSAFGQVGGGLKKFENHWSRPSAHSLSQRLGAIQHETSAGGRETRVAVDGASNDISTVPARTEFDCLKMCVLAYIM